MALTVCVNEAHSNVGVDTVDVTPAQKYFVSFLYLDLNICTHTRIVGVCVQQAANRELQSPQTRTHAGTCAHTRRHVHAHTHTHPHKSYLSSDLLMHLVRGREKKKRIDVAISAVSAVQRY